MRIKFKYNKKEFFYLFLSSFLILSIAIGRVFDSRLAILGINISWFFIFIVLICCVLSIFNYKYLNSNIYFYLLIIFWLIISISTISGVVFHAYPSEINNIAIEITFNFLLLFLLPSFLIFLINDFEFINKIAYFIFYLSLLMGIIGFLKLIVIGFEFSNVNRLSVLGGPIVFSRWILSGILFLITIRPFTKLINIILILLLFVCSIYAASKGPLLAFIICLIILYLKNNRVSVLKTFTNYKFYLILIITLLILIPLLTSLMPGRLKDLLEFNFQSTSFQARFLRYTTTFQMILDHPFGVGIGKWALYYNQIAGTAKDLDQYPHNIFLEVFSELGWIAGLILLTIIIFAIRNFSKLVLWSEIDLDLKKCAMFYYLYTFFFLINSLISGNINDARFLFLGLTFLVWFKLNKNLLSIS